jgi:O-antigen/teichoic acid export membrane protein
VKQQPGDVRSASIYLLTTALNAAIPFLLLPVLTRVLSPADYGIVAMFGLMLAVFGAFTGINVHGAISVRYFQLGREELAAYVSTCLAILVASTAVTGFVVILAGAWLSELTSVPADWLLVAVAAAAVQFLINIRLSLWQVTGQARAYGTLVLSQGLVNAAASLLLVLVIGMGWQGRVLGQVLAASCCAAIAIWHLARAEFIRPPTEWRKHAADALRFGIPLIPHVIGGLLIVAADRFVIVNMLGTAEAGIYMVALQVAQVIGFATDSFNKAYTPWLMKRLAGSEAAPRLAIVRGTYAYFAVIVAAACLYGALAPGLLEVLVGGSFRAAGALVIYLAVGFAFGGCYFMVTSYIFFESRTGLIAAVTFFSGLVNILLAIVLVSHYGLEGAALAFMLSNAMTFAITWWMAQKVHPMPWLRALRAVGS